MGRRDHLNVAESRRQQDQAPSRLWYAILRTAHYRIVIVIASIAESILELLEDGISPQTWDILHRDDFGPQCGDHFTKLGKQLPLGILIKSPIGVRRKRLTGSAACKNPDTIFRKQRLHELRRYVGHIFLIESGFDIHFEWVFASRVDVDPGANRDASALQSVGKPASATKEIDGSRLRIESSLVRGVFESHISAAS